VERPEIVEILIESLHCPSADERRVAYAFLREIAVRHDEPLTRRLRLTLYLALYRTQHITVWTRGLIKKIVPTPDRVTQETGALVLSFREAVLEGYRSSRSALLFALIVAASGYFWTRDTLSTFVTGTLAVMSTARSLLIDTVAGALVVIGDLSRRLHGAVTAAYAAALGTTETVYILTYTAFVVAYCAFYNAVQGAYTGLVGIVVDSFTGIRDTVRLSISRLAGGIARMRAAVVARYIKARDAVALFIARIVDRVTRSYRLACLVSAEIKRHATRQVLPQGATPLIAAALVCLVLFVFGINSYFVVSGVNKKGIFIDLSRYEWGDEALASILIGEGYDIYLNEKITEKRIKQLLASGHYYERIIRVTGYYSPLPDQKKYATGSYRGDIILNGRGIMGSDTTPVYIGMAAGPPHLEYGTNVIIEDLGKFDLPKVYTVHDRGGAINGNRLDIWVGKGEEAMEKAYKITGYYKVIVVGDR
jgi:3D (Asp-Asp-Asp) domain-containing protein